MTFRRGRPGWAGVLLAAVLSPVLAGCDLLPGRAPGAGGTMTADARGAGSTDTASAGAAAGAVGSRSARHRAARAARARRLAEKAEAGKSGAAAPGGGSAPTTGPMMDTAVPPVPPPPVLDPLTGAMRDDLRRLVAAQKQHFANQGQYSSRLADLAIRYLPHAGVSIQITSAGTGGWTGRAVADARPGTSCVVWVGTAAKPATDAQHRSPAAAGVPVCDSL
ncbi:MAG TPA: hypothetical protein VFS40_13890 [Gemmatimonadales bacterium]|nr:hypothetical protein [Gemmatimonadales bacterium]